MLFLDRFATHIVLQVKNEALNQVELSGAAPENMAMRGNLARLGDRVNALYAYFIHEIRTFLEINSSCSQLLND